MWEDFIPRVDKICEFYGIKKVELAEIIGTAQSNLSTHGVHHKEAYRILVNYPDINARWLLFGEGDMLTQKEADPQNQPDPTPEGVTMIGDEAVLYKYMYEKTEAKLEIKEKEIMAATERYIATITRLQIENEQLRKRINKPYRTDEETPSLMAAESTDNNN
jgi:hypothetical protein